MIKILLLFITLFFSFNLRVDASLCDKEHIATLKELAEQVEVSYEYLDYSEEILSGEDGDFPVNVYDINVSLINDKFYLYYGGNKYFYNKNGLIKLNVNSGDIEMSIHSNECFNLKLRTIELNLPKFNIYTYKKECRGLEDDVDICNPWYKGRLTDELFYELFNKYINSKGEIDESFWNNIVSFVSNYIFHIIVVILMIVVIIILIFNYRKRSVLE